MEIKKEELLTKINLLEKQIETFEMPVTLEKLGHLRGSLLDNHYTIMVVGEFNSGKSTFINALLKQNLLPTGITPTTATINTCLYNEEEIIEVYSKDKEVEKLPWSKKSLEKYIAKNQYDISNIDFIKIGAPIKLLENNVILIDTPGLNDVEELRSDITYEMLPRADVVFFVINITTAFKATEYNFIKEVMLKEGMDRIVFVANFIDEMDEDEISGRLKSLRYIIKHEMNIANPQLIELCAKEAVDGYSKNDKELIEFSNIEKVEQKMYDICFSGSKSVDKMKRLYSRFYFILKEYSRSLLLLEQFQQKDIAQLKIAIEKIADWDLKNKEHYNQINDYLELHKLEIREMIRKSVDYEFNNIETEVEDSIMAYYGNDFTEYVETRIPLLVKNRLKNWVEQYTPKIHLLLKKLEHGLSTGLATAFERDVLIESRYEYLENNNDQLHFSFDKVMNTNITSGLLVGGASAVLLSIGAPILIPIIGMAGMPFIRESMQKQQLQKLKPQVHEHVMRSIQQQHFQFTDHLLKYVDTNISLIEKETYHHFEGLCQQVKVQIETQITEMEKDTQNSIQQGNYISKCLKQVRDEQEFILGEIKNV